MGKKKKRKQKQKSSQKTKNVEKSVTTPEKTISLTDLKTEGHERWQRKQLRRQIREEFLSLPEAFNEDESFKVAEFLVKYEKETQLMRESLQQYKDSKDFRSDMVWRYISNDASPELRQLVKQRKLFQDQRLWFESRIPEPIVFPLELSPNGPLFEMITPKVVRTQIEQYIENYAIDFEIIGTFPIAHVKDSYIQLKFENGIVITRTLKLVLQQAELPQDCQKGFNSISSFVVSEQQNILKFLKQCLADTPPTDILKYYPVMTQVLRTAYEQGYWQTPWVQSILNEWRGKKEKYHISQQFEFINQSDVCTIKEGDFTEVLNEQRIKEHVQHIISSNEILSQYHSLHLDISGNIERMILPVNIFNKDGLLIGTIYIKKPVNFLPAKVKQGIQQTPIDAFLNMYRCRSKEELLEMADKETGKALKISNNNKPDYEARAERLAGICCIMLKQGYGDDIQFKRTLCCYYAARGGQFFENNVPIEARYYYLLFFRMLYQEKMIGHLKAFRSLDYPVLANLFATYLIPKTRSLPPPSTAKILRDMNLKDSHHTIESQAPMLWRAVQLLVESSQNFFELLLNLYEIDEDFVRHLLLNLSLIKETTTLKMRSFSIESQKFRRDLLAFSFKSVPSSVTTEFLLEFILSVLGIRDVAFQVFKNIQRVLEQARLSVSAKDAVQKSTLLTKVNEESLDAKAAVGRLIHSLRGSDEQTKKKAGNLQGLLEEIKGYVIQEHREFFKSAKLQVTINTFTLPKGELSPVEIYIMNSDFGQATNMIITIEKDPSFCAQNYSKSIQPLFGKKGRVEALYISPLADRAIELRGAIKYSDQERQDKRVTFSHTIQISDPKAFKPFDSPYVTGAPVRDPEMFFGRRDELKEIVRLFRGHYQDRIVVIHGRRRVGKTSILYQLKQG